MQHHSESKRPLSGAIQTALLLSVATPLIVQAADVQLSDLDGSNGIVLNGVEPDLVMNVSGAGDINGDGIEDVVSCARQASADEVGVGACYVVFGTDTSLPAVVELSSLDGSNGFTVFGSLVQENIGRRVSGVGDINGDGIDDLALATNQFRTHLIFGQNSGFPASLSVSDFTPGTALIINGPNATALNAAGDVNGDGIDDLFIGSDVAGPNTAGQVYVVFGRDSGFPDTLALSDLDGSDGFTINGINNNDYVGAAVSSAGDLNGDGFDDVLVGGPRVNSSGYSAGASYVVWGDDDPFPASVELSALDGSNGFSINGVTAYDQAGEAVSCIGDINGDKIDDILIGASFADVGDTNGAGSGYVIFGSQNTFPASFDLSALDGVNGFRIDGPSMSGFAGRWVDGGRDTNGDGMSDLVMLARNQIYTVFGRDTSFASPLELSGLTGASGFVIDAVNEQGQPINLGRGGIAGDINQDGINDIITTSGDQSFLIYGRDSDSLFTDGFEAPP